VFTARYELDMYDSDSSVDCSVCCTLLAVTMRGCRRNGPNYHAMRTFPNSLIVLYKVKRSALNGDHVQPSTCGLVSAMKPLVGFS
jgi:hypothetical protein